MTEKVIYLDFDGVVNDTHTPIISLRSLWGTENTHSGLCKDLMERVNQIHDATGAVVWVHSSWREAYSEETLNEVLNDAGLRAPYCGNVGLGHLQRKMSYHGDGRGADIRKHIEENGIENYVILDDMCKSAFKPEDHPCLVKTNPKIGIQDADVKKAIEILNA